MRPEAWVLIHSHLDPCKKRGFEQRHIRDGYTQKRRHSVSQGEASRLQAEERGHRRNQTCQHLKLRLLTSRTVGKEMFLEASRSEAFSYDSLS